MAARDSIRWIAAMSTGRAAWFALAVTGVPIEDDAVPATDFPLIFMSPNTGSRIHSQFGNLNVIKQNSESPAVEISLSDASQRVINQGDLVKIYNNNGSVVTKARITGRLRPGLVVLHNGIWFEEGGGSNRLTGLIETDIRFGAAFHGQRVQVVKYTEE